MNIYPANGNPKIAAMIMNFALFGKDNEQNLRESILKAQVDELSLSFYSQEKANEFVDSFSGSLASIVRFYINDSTVDVMPAYSIAEHAARIINHAIFDYTASLTGIHKFTIRFLSEEDADAFFESINKHVNDYFGFNAFSLKES